MRKVAVVGASGFVGTTLVEQLLHAGSDEVIPLIRSSGNAWRLARLGIELRSLNLLDPGQLASALRGATHVVNCSRGGNDVMLRGLKNLLTACKQAKIERFVHLGSVAVYGDPPPPESADERARTSPARDSYGWVKLQQDAMISKACAEGLPAVILCPPNISGPYSAFLLGVVDALRSGTFALLDGGESPCNLVDVRNLSGAIELALNDGPADGTRLFVTDDEDTNWLHVVNGIAPLLEPDRPIPTIGREELIRSSQPQGESRHTFFHSLKHLVSSDVRHALRKDPLWARVDTTLRRAVAGLGSAAEDAIRNSIEGPLRVSQAAAGPQLNLQLCRQQLRGVRHSPELAKRRLGYRPLFTFEESMHAFRTWFRSHQGMDSDVWPLLRQLAN